MQGNIGIIINIIEIMINKKQFIYLIFFKVTKNILLSTKKCSSLFCNN